MIHFLHSHPSLIEDLETAVQIISRHCPDNDISYCTTAHHLQMLADELNYMDNAVGWTDPLHSDNAFRLNVGDAKSSWKRWQDNCYTIAKQYDGYIFTYGGISALVKRLNEHASKFKNAEPIKEPDWKFCWAKSPLVRMANRANTITKPK